MEDIKKIFRFVKPYWKLAVLSLILLIFMVLFDLSIPRLIERIIDQGIKQKDLAIVLQTSALMIVISLLDALVAVLNNIYSIRVGESVARDIRKAIFVKVQNFSYGNLDHFSTGKLMVRLTSDTSAVQRITQVSLRIGTRAPLMMIGSIILMFITSKILALTMVPLLVVASAVILFFSVRMEPFFRSVQQRLDRLNTVLQENIAGAHLVKSFVRGDFEGQRFETANEDLTQNTIKVMQFMSAMSPALTVFINIGLVLVIWVGGLQAIAGNLSLGQIVAFTNYLLSTMTPLIMMTQLSNTWANGIASAKRINEVLDAMPEVPASLTPQRLPTPSENRVIFENVDFHYNSNTHLPVLEDICLSAEPGQTVAILGATGSGKTSLINLIPRFYDTTSGQVSVDGVNVRDLAEEDLLAHIAIVPQETILFTGTIRDNLCYGRPDATDEEIIAAAKAAQAHDFIEEMPDGYNTRVEERGSNLSGGQKQRIAIARALVTHPDILILDDSTSAVDVETESKIQSALLQILRGRTCFVVAQRISTVLNADKIVVLDRGRIAAEGTHAELLKSSKIYQEIYDSQLGGGIRESAGA
ncbi:MAG: ABC transporter ATP-binding protein [Anaerolineaceae bacterium]|nr:ABC transporter ATP-binding protein [Anaerolineaceae bacterium]